MNRRLFSVAVFILVAAMAVPLIMRLGLGKAPEPVTLAELDVGNGRSVRVTVEPNSQQTLSLHYHVSVDGQTVVDHAFFGTLPRTSPPPAFVVYTAEQGRLVGIAQASVPRRIVILHDFKTGDSFPMRRVTYKDTDPKQYYPYYEERASILARGEALFDRLCGALPEKDFELLRSMGMRPLTVPTTASPPAEPGPGRR